jgi:glycosyltransferase involved in cell wall biosynthesis
LKILMVSDVYPPQNSGGARHVQALSRELARRGVQVIVCTVEVSGQPDFEEEPNLKIYRLPDLISKIRFLYNNSDRFPSPLADPVLSGRLNSIIEKEKPDAIHSHGWIIQSVISTLKNKPIPAVLTLHDYRAICPAAGMIGAADQCDMRLSANCVSCSRPLYGGGPVNTLKRWAVYLATRSNKGRLKRSVDKYIAVSSFVNNIHQRCLNLTENAIITIPNFYSRDLNEIENNTNILPEDFILFVGRLVPEKGVDVLIQSFTKLKTNTKLVLIGAKSAIRFEGNENIVVVENAPYDLVKEAYRKCKFAVFPSIWPEPSATVVFEAMSFNKAVIASLTGGFPDIIIENETGLLVPPRDVDALSAAIQYLLDNPGQTREMGERGFERWKNNFTSEAVVPRIEKVYIDLISQKVRNSKD